MGNAMAAEDREKQQVRKATPGGDDAKLRQDRGERANAHNHEKSIDAVERVEALDGVELKFIAQSLGMKVKRRECAIHGNEAKRVNGEERGKLREAEAKRRGRFGKDVPDAEIKKELQWINVEEDEKEHDEGDHARRRVIQAIAAAEFVVTVPNHREQQETDGEGGKSAHGVEEVVEGSRNIE